MSNQVFLLLEEAYSLLDSFEETNEKRNSNRKFYLQRKNEKNHEKSSENFELKIL